MKRLFLLGVFCVILFSCKKYTSKVKQPITSSSITSNGFNINGELENFYPKKVYLNKIIENSIYTIDSSEVLNNNFTFKGIVEFPERFALTFENYSSTSIFIIENTQFDLFISSDQINEPQITGSKTNTLLNQYRENAKLIFKKIDYLFPQFQKARLENDAERLNKIGEEMEKIEKEFTDFSFNFIIQNKDSYVAAMILRDQLKSTNIDTLRIKNTYQVLAYEIKNSPDALIIASFLNLH